ncbi:hypothetical protein D3C85_1020130 [compost metagenome]
MSSMANGPMAMPNSPRAASTCCTLAPSSTSSSASRMYCRAMRLPTKPSHTPTTTATFFRRLPSCMALASTAALVCAPRTTSSRRMTLAGLKKCRPSTSCGRRVKAAMRFRSRDEVLLARMAPGLHTRSSASKTACLAAISSNTASMARSTLASAA